MYASAFRNASDVMVDDHVKIGENGLLYCISEIESMKDDDLELVLMKLYYAGDDTKTTVGALCVKPTERLKIYNQ
jgi:hypothetical protein